MGLAFPLGLLAAALAGPLILLYVLKLRRRTVVVSSTLPWRSVLQDRRANAPWERLRRHLLLLLQLIVLLLLVLAFAGPHVRTQTILSGDAVLVLDASASMQATVAATGRTRFEEARARLAESLLSLDGTRRAALVLAGPQPRVIAPLSAERAALQRALDEARPADAPADVGAALELASTLARGASASEVVLITDGAFDATPAVTTALAGVRVVRADEAAAPANAGIVSLALRPVAGEAGVHELFIGVRSHGSAAPLQVAVESAAAPRSATDAPDPASWTWTPVARETVVPDASGAASRLVRVQAVPGAVLRVTLPAGDALRADDEAMVVVPERPVRRILLASAAPFLLERALGALRSVEVVVTPGAPGSGEGFDAVVIDGPLPDVLPARPVLQFGAPQGATGTLDGPRILRWQARHPALRHARFDAVRVESAHAGPLAPGSDVLVESDQGPLAVTWPAPGGRALAFRFGLTDSDLPLRIAFPVLVADAVDWLTEGAEGEGVLPSGRAHELAMADAPVATLLARGAEPQRLQARAGMVELPPLSRSGVVALVPEGGAPRLVAIALMSPEETDLSARGITAAPQAREAGLITAPQTVPGRRPLWPWAVALAMLVLMLEWTVHHRRRE